LEAAARRERQSVEAFVRRPLRKNQLNGPTISTSRANAPSIKSAKRSPELPSAGSRRFPEVPFARTEAPSRQREQTAARIAHDPSYVMPSLYLRGMVVNPFPMGLQLLIDELERWIPPAYV
jgi:hypothetical protein